jgi:glycosyltransferase involved in cell wall biosynthesis
MRIGLIAPPWVAVPPPLYGGTELVVDELARGLAGAGHDVVLFTTGDSRCPVRREWLFEHAQPAKIGDAGVELRHVEAAYEALAGCDIVHDHTMVGPAQAYRYPGLPVVTTCHGPLTPDAASWYARLGDRVAIVAISHAQRAQAPDLRVAQVIHHGIDPTRFRVGRGDGGYVVFLGRMAPEKGADRAIMAARAAGVRLVLAGKVWAAAERRYFDAEVRPLLGDDAVFVGEVGGTAKNTLLGGAGALLNPIRWAEPFGLVMIEAFACGTPVLTFPEGAAIEIVDHGLTGLICDDESDMAAAIGRVPELARDACRGAVETRFSAARMVREHVALYQHLLTESVHAAPPSGVTVRH